MIRIGLVAIGIACGAFLASAEPARLADLRAQIASLPGMAWLEAEAAQSISATDEARHDRHDDDGAIKLSDQQIAATGIDVGKAQSGVLSRRRSVPGLVTPSGDRIARVAVRLLGTVVELRKRLGDPVEQDEVVAVIESREVADAKSEYLATRVTDELQQTLFARATSLWQSRS
jgi:cobalt-zinc-cadmium efflux system membrane fusion protein